jgi:uncharacterized repeat protein (TIGR01451 family)
MLAKTVRTRSLTASLVGAALAALVVTPAAAVEGLDLTTPYPAVQVDPGGEVTFPLAVGTTQPEVVGLEVTEAPEGFETKIRGGGFIVSSVFSDPGVEEPPELELEVTVPEGLAPGTYDVQLLATGTAGTTPLDLQLTVGEVEAGTVTLETEVPSVRGDSGQTFSFDLTLSNDTAQEIPFGLEAASAQPGWDVTATFSGEEQAATSLVGAGETATVNVEAVPLDDLAAGLYDIGVRAVGGDQTAEAALQVEITGSYAMELTTQNERLSTTVQGGSSTTLPLVVRNSGTADLTGVTITDIPPTGWEVTYSQETVDVPAGQDVVVEATITPPGDAVSGDYQLSFDADNEDATADTLVIRTTVETSTTWGFVGIALIALVVVGLLLVFRRYGRR